MPDLLTERRVNGNATSPALRRPLAGDVTLTVTVVTVASTAEIVVERSADRQAWATFHRIGPFDSPMTSRVVLRAGEYYRARKVGGDCRLSVSADTGTVEP